MVVECLLEWHRKNSCTGTHLFPVKCDGQPRQLRKRKRATTVAEDSSDVDESDLNSDLELDKDFEHKEITLDQG